MTTCNEIYQIIRNIEKEKIKIELKDALIFSKKEGQEKLAHEIVSFANRYGGKVFIGITDNGIFNGHNIFDVDECKGIIDNICHNSISPEIDYNIEVVQCKEGDVLIINVAKRKGIPHAYIKGRRGSDIKNRSYLGWSEIL